MTKPYTITKLRVILMFKESKPLRRLLNLLLRAKTLTIPRDKNGKPRTKNPKPTIIPERKIAQSKYWIPLRDQLREFIQIFGRKEVFQSTSLSDSQLHRITCSECEHNQEPNFSQGKEIEALIASLQILRPATLSLPFNL